MTKRTEADWTDAERALVAWRRAYPGLVISNDRPTEHAMIAAADKLIADASSVMSREEAANIAASPFFTQIIGRIRTRDAQIADLVLNGFDGASLSLPESTRLSLRNAIVAVFKELR